MRFFFTVCLFIVCIHSNAQVWNLLADFSGDARDDATTFTIDNHVYCGLGMNTWFSCTSDFKVFDVTTETWSNGVNLPTGQERQYANGFSYQGFGYVFGGINGSTSYLNDCWKFNPQTNAWTMLPALPSSGRAGAISFLIGDTVYIVGGKTTGGIISNEVWAFDLVQEQWVQKANVPFDGIWRGVAFSWNDTGIIGLGKLNNGTLNSGCYQYTPNSDTWQLMNQLNLTPTTYSMFAQIGKFGFIYGGVLENQTYSNQFLRINLETWETTILTSFPAAARRGGVAFVGDNDFYITTGVSLQARLNETWKSSEILGLDGTNELEHVRIYPNPLKNFMVVQSEQMIQRIEIHDLLGKVVGTQLINSNQIEIPIDLENGCYIVKLIAHAAEFTQRICVQN
jgi:N-acetylneuraminic acid mutarotase